MDRNYPQQPFDRSPMQTHWDAPFELLLRVSNAERLRSHTHEAHRRNLYSKALLWFSTDHARSTKRRARRQSKTDPGNHAEAWTDWESTGSQHFEEPPAAPQIPVSPARSRDFRASTGLEYRYHVHPIARRLRLSRCSNRLVQSAGALAPPLKQLGGCFLPRGIRRSNRRLWAAGHLQHRSRGAIHFSRICECSSQQRDPTQYGRTRSSIRQYLCRTSMEICEI